MFSEVNKCMQKEPHVKARHALLNAWWLIFFFFFSENICVKLHCVEKCGVYASLHVHVLYM